MLDAGKIIWRTERRSPDTGDLVGSPDRRREGIGKHLAPIPAVTVDSAPLVGLAMTPGFRRLMSLSFSINGKHVQKSHSAALTHLVHIT